MPYDEELANRIRGALVNYRKVEEKLSKIGRLVRRNVVAGCSDWKNEFYTEIH